ncbi:MAG: phosphoribosylformylglycinamidine cyclo-ligase, partial [Candidatus Omnitrophota bacterium]|nr:phosphoribosylformylglycinamidine cyclo-ligase [Candidatus Omnitrophota bacterium]
MNYKKAGVDIDRSNKFIKEISSLVSKTRRSEVLGGIGGFSSLVKIPKKFKDPVLVSSTDGVGTKLMLAELQNNNSTIGIDLVSMCVNDIVVTGAEPLFFLDYFATGKLNNKKAKDILKGIANGCKEANCALIGGETAEVPGVYKGEEYDLAGFCVGLVDKKKIIDGAKVRPGDKIIGIESSGVHSNGFSLVRKVFTKRELKGKLGKILLTPTIIYVSLILRLIGKINVKSIAHITGGGFYDNIPRVLPKNMGAVIYKDSWKAPEIFSMIQKRARIDKREMFRTFNMGIGMALVVNKKDVNATHRIISSRGLRSWTIGEIVKG